VKSVRTALRVFEEVAARQPVGLSELSRRLDVPKASVQRALTTLADAGWLRHDVSAPGSWVVTARFSVLADASPEVIAARDAARPVLSSLREKLDGSPGFFVLDGDRMVLLAGPEETLLRTLVQLGKALSIGTLAEGIEQQRELSLLQAEDCDSGQGFLYARPLDIDATEAIPTTAVKTLQGDTSLTVYRGPGSSFRDFIINQGCDILHPDLRNSGGFLETKRIADFAEVFNLPMATHNTGSQLNTWATVHWAGSIRDYLCCETITGKGDWMDQVLALDRPYIKGGMIELSAKPGLGVDLNADVVKAHLATGESWWG